MSRCVLMATLILHQLSDMGSLFSEWWGSCLQAMWCCIEGGHPLETWKNWGIWNWWGKVQKKVLAFGVLLCVT